MVLKKFVFFMSCLLVFLCYVSPSAERNRFINTMSGKDTVCNVWVIFTGKPDKNIYRNKDLITGRAIKRRVHSEVRSVNYYDYPVSEKYINSVTELGARLRNKFKWANTASFSTSSRLLKKISSLPFVREIIPVSVFSRRLMPGKSRRIFPGRVKRRSFYGECFTQLSIVGIPQAQYYLDKTKHVKPGKGVLIASFDSGFWLDIPCFDFIRNNNSVVSDSDFVDHDSEPYLKLGNLVHGACTMSHIAGYDPGSFIGSAWAAEFVLARTEDESVEMHIEEDNWAAAVVWAESLGVDILTSSLGYREGFTEPDSPYVFEDLDGKTTIIARACDAAVERGMLIVTAIGNGGSNKEGTLISPADVKNVVSAGAVDSTLKIADFSSTGPTADGRIKPDLVTMGKDVVRPTYSGYARGHGTSYSAPIAAGIFALVRQVYPAETSGKIRERVYRSCRLSPFQDTVDIRYGRGIPDALLAILDTTDSYMSIYDSIGNPIINASVFRNGDLIGSSDSMGTVIISYKESSLLPDTLTVEHKNFQNENVIVNSRHVKKDVTMSAYIFHVYVTGNSKVPLPIGKVYWKKSTENKFSYRDINPGGYGTVLYSDSGYYDIYVVSPGFKKSEVYSKHLVCASDTMSIALNPRPVSHFAVYPNVLSVKDILNSGQGIKIDFLATKKSKGLCRIAIRTIGGSIVWQYSDYLLRNKPLLDKSGKRIQWNCRTGNGDIIAPGIYIITINYAGKTYLKKLMITG